MTAYALFRATPITADNRQRLNLYEPIMHQPMPGDWSAIDGLLRHIFEEHYEYGLD